MRSEKFFPQKTLKLGGYFQDFLFSSLPGEDSHVDDCQIKKHLFLEDDEFLGSQLLKVAKNQ